MKWKVWRNGVTSIGKSMCKGTGDKDYGGQWGLEGVRETLGREDRRYVDVSSLKILPQILIVCLEVRVG